MRTAYRDITAYLARLRRALNRVGFFEATSLSIIALGVCLVGGLLLAAHVDRVPGLTVMSVGLVSAITAFWLLWWRPRHQRREDDTLALFVEHEVDGLHSAIITAVQTHRLIQLEPDPKRLGFSPELAGAAAERAAATLIHHPPAGLVATQRLRSLAIAAFVILGGVAAAVTLAPGFVVAGWQAIVAPPEPVEEAIDGRVVDVAVGDFVLEITPPAYLGLNKRTERSSSGAIRAVRGSEVRYVAATLEPAVNAVVVMESQPDARWGVSVRDGGIIEGKVRIGDDDRYQFILGLEDGTQVHERTWRAIQSVADGVPEVRLLLPESDLEVHQGDEVPLLFEASDDFGLTMVELVAIGPEGDEKLRQPVKQPQGGRTARGTYSLAVASLGLQPGQSAEVYFEATDINTLSGPGVSRSAGRTLTMYSPEQEHEELLSDLKRLIDGLVDVVADRLESPIEEKRAMQLYDYISTQTAISKKEAVALKALEKMMVAFRTDPLTDDAFRNGMKKAYDALKAAHDQEASQLQKAVSPDIVTPRPPVLVQLLFAANNDGISALETTIFALKQLLDKARQDKVLKQGREMLEVQNELRELMKKMKDGDPEARRKALAKIAQLQAKLRKMQREMMKMAERVPYENQNMNSKPPGDMADAKSMADQMDQIDKLLREGKVDEAMKLLEELNKSTQELMAGLQSDFQRMQVSQKGRQMMSEFQQQLGQVADGQRGLNAETGEEQRKLAQQQMSEMRDALEGAKQDAQAIRKQLDNVDKGALHPQDQQALNKLQGDAKRLQQQLEQMDPEGAQGTAGELAKGSKALKKEVGEGAERESKSDRVDKMEKAQKGLGDAGQAAQNLAQRLQQMAQGQGNGQGRQGEGKGSGGTKGEGTDGKQSAGLKRLGKRQSKLGKQLGGLKDALDQLNKEIPGLRDKLKPDLDKARKNMDSAAKELGKGRGKAARERQNEAQEQLDKAMQSLEQTLKEQRGKAGEQPGVNDPREKVGIPGEDAVPREFRKELLEKMKERAPEKYKKRIDRYYKELVK